MFPPVKLPVTTTPVPLAPGVEMVMAVALPGMKGNPMGFPLGVIVRLPITMFGAFAEPVKLAEGVMVDEPRSVAVKVVNTSTKVVVLRGSEDVGVGFVVGASVIVVIAANATPDPNMVVVAVTLDTGARTLAAIFAPPVEQVENPRKPVMNCCCPAASNVTCPPPWGKVSVNARGSVDVYAVDVQTPFAMN